MRIFLACLLLMGGLLGGAGIYVYEAYDLESYRKAPPLRLSEVWAEKLVEQEAQDPKLRAAMTLIEDWSITLEQPYFGDLLEQATPPFRKSTKGRYKLVVSAIPWVEEMKYGFLLQHQLIDTDDNITFEFTIDTPVGQLW